MMAEKILGLLAAFVLGALAGFFYFSHCLKFVLEHNLWGLRTKVRGWIVRYELNELPRRASPVYAVPSPFHAESLAIELGCRGVSGRCPLCGADRPCDRHPDVMFLAGP